MKAVVTGATGFLGKAIIRELLNHNVTICALVKNKNNIPISWKNKVKILECNMENYNTLTKDEIGFEPDVFYHFAWNGTSGTIRSNYEVQIQNIRYSCDALELAQNIGCKRFINAGSIMEWDVKQYFNNDNMIIRQNNIYSMAKFTADYYMKILASKYNLSYINAMISNVYGVGEISERFINTTVKKMLYDENIPFTHGEQMYDFIYITDAARMFYLIGLYGKTQENYYIGNPFVRPLKEFIVEMKEVLMSKSILEFGYIPSTETGFDYSNFDIKKVYREMNFKIEISFSQGIQMLANWLKKMSVESQH